jgi:predicted enzyme related to lactoylglutathione lyase
MEIPVTDVVASARFYGGLFGWSFHEAPTSDTSYSVFSSASGAEGALERHDAVGAGNDGPLVYVLVDDLDTTCSKAVELGGAVERPRTPIGGDEHGSYALILDPNGTRIGLFSR